MFKGNLNQLEQFTGVHAKIIECIKQVKELLDNNSQHGTYPLIDDKAFFFVVDEHTQALEERRSEIHQRYIDVQIVLKGEEKFGYCEQTFLSIEEDQLAENDVAFSEDLVDEKFEVLGEGDFIIFHTKQPHRPLIAVNQPAPVKKVVIKIDKSLIE
ncbi:YhcH/YjgK/YiaL family protein [Aliivibrio kagoshimensis]|uniref:YhcH/YjgK/YiaL family protein n=1 Tax=Aliivibrio kagoshimensis TaxID=2910230 RepID=UPI003D145C8F